MHQQQIVADNHVETDALFDTSPKAMAERFGARVRRLLADGDIVRTAARNAFSYAFLADPTLRIETVPVVNRRPELVH